jgi:hypothetical protein
MAPWCYMGYGREPLISGGYGLFGIEEVATNE